LPYRQITAHITSQLAYPSTSSNTASSSATLLDLFSGAGGNTISFALSGHFDRVIGVENNASTLFCARHNAQIYGIGEGNGRGKVDWVHGDVFDALEKMIMERRAKTESERQREQIIAFASPPWGGGCLCITLLLMFFFSEHVGIAD
jgi:trimethylguanosine synthase